MMYDSSSKTHGINTGLVSAMDQALAKGQYRTYGYICTGAIAYNPVANGGEGPLGQRDCITALQNVASQVFLVTDHIELNFQGQH